MSPEYPEVLAFLAKVLPSHAGQSNSSYSKKQLGTAATLLSMMAQDIDRLVPRLVEEAQAIRAIFASASGIVEDKHLASELVVESQNVSDDLHLSKLTTENDRLRELLIRLHAHVEASAGANARGIEAMIWQELVAQTERRRTRFLKI